MADQFSLEVQRQIGAEPGVRDRLRRDVRERSVPDARRQPAAAVLRQPVHDGPRVDPTRRRDPSARQHGESWYHSLQTGLDKRLSHGLSAGVHYTWSRYLDTASEVFNPSSGEVAVAQDSFDIDADKGRVRVRSPAPPHAATSSGSCRGCATSEASSARCSAAGRSARSSRSRAARRSRRSTASDPTGRARRDRRAGRQRDPAESQHRSRSVEA